MENKNNELRPLRPSSGTVLTNGIAYSETEIYLGVNDDPANWHEITKEEYEKILAEQAEREVDLQ